MGFKLFVEQPVFSVGFSTGTIRDPLFPQNGVRRRYFVWHNITVAHRHWHEENLPWLLKTSAVQMIN